VSETTHLSPEEIFGITEKKQPAAQLRALRRMGIRAYRRDNGKGSVCVLRAWLAPSAEAAPESKPRRRSERERQHGPTAQI
jgi:hypothetical protein